jgi:hypothetical protein
MSSDISLAIAKMILPKELYGLKTFLDHVFVKYKRSAQLGFVMLEDRT